MRLPHGAFITMKNTSPCTDISDYEAIRHALNLYLDACAKGNSSIMKSAFHPDSLMCWVEEGQLQVVPIQTLYDIIDSLPASPHSPQQSITSIIIEQDIAQARIETDMEEGHRYSDMFTLAKTSQGWKIISKTYHQHR